MGQTLGGLYPASGGILFFNGKKKNTRVRGLFPELEYSSRSDAHGVAYLQVNIIIIRIFQKSKSKSQRSFTVAQEALQHQPRHSTLPSLDNLSAQIG
jgi:hypothetical protein